MPNRQDMCTVQRRCTVVTCSIKTYQKCNAYTSYCANKKLGEARCNFSNNRCACGLFGWLHRPASQRCTPSSTCPNNQECVLPRGDCVATRTVPVRRPCIGYNQPCSPTGGKKCCQQDSGTPLYCHAHGMTKNKYTCRRTAFVGDACGSGIPCEGSSQCVKQKCSLREGDACKGREQLCISPMRCQDKGISGGVYNVCAR
ncbi:unnamed protein product [Absidia cylindrospora]